MISITPLTAAALGHRAFHVAVADSGHVGALSREGIGSLLAPDHLTVTRFEVGGHVGGVGISPDGKLLALLKENAMSLIALPGLAEKDRVVGTIEGCLFSPSGRLLWAALHTSSETHPLKPSLFSAMHTLSYILEMAACSSSTCVRCKSWRRSVFVAMNRDRFVNST